MQALNRFENETLSMVLADVDKQTKHKKNVKCLLILRDLFGRTVYAKTMKTKDSKETVGAL